MNSNKKQPPNEEQRTFGHGHHPNSIQARLALDPALRAKFYRNRARYQQDRLAFAAWVAGGCTSGISTDEIGGEA